MSRHAQAPSYQHHKATGQALVNLFDVETGRRKDFYLGKYDTRASRDRYTAMMAAWEARGRCLVGRDRERPRRRHAKQVVQAENPAAKVENPAVGDVQLLLAQVTKLLGASVDPRKLVTVAQVIDAYLLDAPNEINERSLVSRKRHLEHFRADFSDKLCMELAGFEVKKWIHENADRYRSPWTRSGVKASVVRAFSWAAENGILQSNPLIGIRLKEAKPTGRCMTEAEFQAILRHADPDLRRFLVALKWSGARPGELSSLRWDDIDWEQKIARLKEHKTARKTGRPRILIFTPPVMKLLRYLQQTRRLPMALELKQLLESQPSRSLPVRQVVAHFKAKGYAGYRALYRSKESIGVVWKWINNRKHYFLPLTATTDPRRRPWAQDGFDAEHVFTCVKHTPWTRQTLTLAFSRLRRKAGLPKDCKMYSLRHKFLTDGVKAGVNLKVLATIAGHVNCEMIDRIYAHIGDDYTLLHDGADRATGH